MMGTGLFAAPTFEALYGTQHEVVALVTQPQRPAKGHRAPPKNRLREIAAAHGTGVFDPPSINTPESNAALREMRPDLFIVADYGQILSPETLSIAPLGGINLHGSLLPKYRGAAPINWAIYHGETETGVTVIHMTPRIDAGPCLAQARLAIGPDETAEELEPRLARLGAPLVSETIDALAAGTAQPIPQDPALASRARRLRKEDGEIDWTRSAEQIKNQVRAMQPWPKTFTYWHRGSGPPLRLIIGRLSVCSMPAAGNVPAQSPGTVIEASKDRLLIATGRDAAWVESIQPEGKRELTPAELLRGYPIEVGDRLTRGAGRKMAAEK
jgi:methionyl-tRNA formyltransferase